MYMQYSYMELSVMMMVMITMKKHPGMVVHIWTLAPMGVEVEASSELFSYPVQLSINTMFSLRPSLKKVKWTMLEEDSEVDFLPPIHA